MDTSDEQLNADYDNLHIGLVAGSVVDPDDAGGSRDFEQEVGHNRPLTSRMSMNNSTLLHYVSLEEKAACVIKDAEAGRARILPKTGKQSTAVIDEGYVVVASHLDKNTVLKIQRGEYINFGKLIPKDCILAE